MNPVASNPIAEPVPAALKGRAPTKEETFYVAWGLETFKANLALANDVLRQIVTVSAVLAGGSFGLLTDRMMQTGFRLTTIAFFLLACAVALHGVLPFEAQVDIRVPAAIKRHKEAALVAKREHICAAACLAGMGFATALLGLFMGT